MSEDSRLLEKLLQFERLRDECSGARVEDLCRDAPELLPELRRRVAELDQLDAAARANELSARDSAALSLASTQAAQGLDATPVLTDPAAARAHYEAQRLQAQEIGNRDQEGASNDIGGYEILGVLGKGGMGRVLRVRDRELDREVAVKVLLDVHARQLDLERRFIQEARIQSRLQHPGIAPIHEIGRTDAGAPFFTMKVIEGRTLADILAERRQLDDGRPKLLKVFEQVCQTVAYAHACGVIHRDLKPLNVMVGAFGEVQVMDWGFARSLNSPSTAVEAEADRVAQAGEDAWASEASRPTDAAPVETWAADLAGTASEQRLTRDGQVFGTLQYMAPEQAQGRVQELDERADVFSLGAMLCEILTGEPPYRKAPKPALYAAVSSGELDDAYRRLEGSGADVELIDLAQRCLNKDAARRFPDASALAEAVSKYLESVQARLRRAEVERAEAETRTQEERKRRRVTAGLALALVVLFAAAAGFAVWWQSQRNDTARKVEEQLATVALFVRQAEEMPAGDAAQASAAQAVWQQALDAADHALSLADAPSAGADLRLRAVEVHASVDDGFERAARLARFLSDLETARLRRFDPAPPAFRLPEIPGVEPQPPSPPTFVESEFPFDWGGMAAAYARAFAEYGWQGVPSNLAAVRQLYSAERSEVQAQIIAALDDWAMALRAIPSRANPSPDEIFDLARALDADPTCQRIRRAWNQRDAATLVAIAAELRAGEPTPELVSLAASALLSVLRPEEAVQLLRWGRVRHADDFWIHSLAGLTLGLGRGREQEEISCYASALAIRPDAVMLYHELASAQLSLGNYDAAIAAYQEAVKREPRLAKTYIALAGAWEAKGDHEAAMRAYQDATLADPESPLGYWVQAATHVQRNEFELALPLLQAAADRGESSCLMVKGALLSELHRLEEAIEAYSQAAAIEPGNAKARYALGWCWDKKGDSQKASTEFLASMELDESYALPCNGLGNVYHTQRRYDAARAMYQEALRRQPDYFEAIFNLGNLHYATRAYVDAAAAYERAIAVNGSHADAHYGLGLALRKTNDLERAAAAHERAIDLNPRHANAFAALSNILRLRGESARAIVAAQAAAAIDPWEARHHYELGVKYRDHGHYSLAKDAFLRAVERDPRDPEARTNLGVECYRSGDLAGAVQQINIAGGLHAGPWSALVPLGRAILLP